MNTTTKLILVFLRLAIGWHFFYEALEKLHDKSWSSRGYLSQATSTPGLWIRHFAGDPKVQRDGAKLSVADPNANFANQFELAQPVDKDKPHASLPKGLNEAWDKYLKTFNEHYAKRTKEALEAETAAGLDEPAKEARKNELEQALKKLQADSETRLSQVKAETVAWLTTGTHGPTENTSAAKKTKLNLPPPSNLEVLKSPLQLLEEYREKLAEAQGYANKDAKFSGSAGEAKAKAALAEANALRVDLQSDWDDQTTRMKLELSKTLPRDWRYHPQPSDPKSDSKAWGKLLWWMDGSVKYGLLLVGAGLLLGLFTRISSVAGALYLILFYLAMPPWPGLPENPKAEGHYLIINKNVIEALALLVLATTASGRWLGLDAWVFGLLGGGSAEKIQKKVEARSEVAITGTPMTTMTIATAPPDAGAPNKIITPPHLKG